MKKILFNTTIGFAALSIMVGIASLIIYLTTVTFKNYEFSLLYLMATLLGSMFLILCNKIGSDIMEVYSNEET